MKTCPGCGRENPSDRDFCQCGEYLRWDPTTVLPAMAPPPEAPPAPEPPAAPPLPSDPAATAAPAAAAPATPPPAAQPPAPRSEVLPVQIPAARPPAAPVRTGPAARVSIALSVPGADTSAVDGPLALAVDPGSRVVLRALIRNQSEIVDNYDLELRGLPEGWWSIVPGVVYLVPFGSSGSYEQTVDVHLHPPRTPEAEARLWELHVVAVSRAAPDVEAVAPFILGIRPYEELETTVRPDRRAGRRKVEYDVRIRNKANAVATVGLFARDDEGSCRTGFGTPSVDIEPGSEATTKLSVRPPKQTFIGRPVDRRLEVKAAGGEEGQRLIEETAAASEAFAKGGMKALAKQYVKAPTASLGPGGLRVQAPRVKPQRAAAGRIDLVALLSPDPNAPAPVELPPTQVVFRHKPWLPWWLAIVAPLLIIGIVALLATRTETVKVPNVAGSPSTFEAQAKLEEAGLTLNPKTEQKVDTAAVPGSVVGQSPKPDDEVAKGAPVALLVAVGDGSVKVPSIVGATLPEAEKTLREAKLALGNSSIQPPDPKAKIRSQIPAEGEVVKEGAPIAIFYPVPGTGASGTSGASGASGASGDGGGDGGGGGGSKGPVTIPAVDKDPAALAGALSKAGLVPEQVSRFSEAKKGEVFGTEPAAGAKAAAGATVRILVSAGFPQLAYDDDANVLLVDGATGKRLPAIAKADAREKDPSWSADGASVAYTAGTRLLLQAAADPNAEPTPLTAGDAAFADPSFAPDTKSSTLAASRINSPTDRNDTDLCVGRVTPDGYRPSCIEDKRFGVSDASWSADGKTILVPAVAKDGKSFGIVRYRSKVPFSARSGDWGKGEFVTPRDAEGGTGVRDMALSPDGKTLAAIANLDTDEFRLYLTKPDDLRLEDAEALPVQACKVVWRADSREVVIVQADELCNQATGQLSRIDLAKPTEAKALSANGDNPAFQPLVIGGS